ncbi:AAA family ATPase [Saccharothrix longispora]|uniref:MinD-like ATPase involved in chromosome partitioning or flagellar assembly n=1 Tax=Saccharothrix longispora TaxID=33920 RepID=A0ABU1Q230_9PSEU|nr:AAA family ATPase [Saccharothrix longispora]MDR6596967.1 MinD-like ATPase involved in chromosome partitioning or flagellar assembly [Saccharothrix longispora]
MTGRYENPEPSWQPPAGAEGQQPTPAQQPNPAQQPHPPQWPEPQQSDQPHPEPQYVEPKTVYIDPSQSGPVHSGPVHSGPVTGPPSGGFPAQGQQSGAYQVSGGPSGAYQVPPGQQSGAYQVSGGPSGAYQVPPGQQSGAYQVSGGPSGAYQVPPGQQSGPYQVPGQQYQGGFPNNFPQSLAPQQPPKPQQANANEVTSQQLIKRAKRPPQSGWRKTLHSMTGGLVNLGESPADLRRRELIGRINQPLRGCYKIAMLSLKGGVGKTTTTTTLGSTFSSLRGDRVIAVDANPDRGTLALKVPRETTATVRHLLRDASRITRYSDVRAYTSQSPSRLEILASEQDPAVSEAFSDEDYLRTVALLELFYNIVLTDCGTGLMHSAMKGVLDQADSLVLVSSGSVDGAQTSAATLDWLDAHGYRDLVAKSVAVINSVRPGSGKVDLDKLAAHFAQRCRAVVRIPFDQHLEEGAEIELDKLAPDTRLALLELAATVADDFPNN